MRWLLVVVALMVCGVGFAADATDAAADTTIGAAPSLAERIAAGAVLIDVRSVDEFASGSVPGAHNLPHDTIAEHIAEIVPDPKTPIVLFCQSGRRAGIALDALAAKGYQNLVNAGGIEAVKEELAK
jgi:phage shock protein E